MNLPDGDPVVKAAIKADLTDVAAYNFEWSNKVAELDAYALKLLSVLEKQGVTTDDPDLRSALIGCWLRYDLPSARTGCSQTSPGRRSNPFAEALQYSFPPSLF